MFDRNTWVIADTHFFHDNIIIYQNRPEDHDDIMLENWINMVRPSDVILHLGDLALTNAETMRILCAHLPGKKYLIRGNHDQRTDTFYRKNNFEVINEPVIYYSKIATLLFTHRALRKNEYPDIYYPAPPYNVHGHSHRKTVDQYDTYLEEYSHRSRYINISVELTDYKPVRISQILEEIEREKK